MKNLFRNTILIVAVATLLQSCKESKQDAMGQDQVTLAKGGVYYGGIFKFNEVRDFVSLYPLAVTEVASFRIGNQMFEGLVEMDQKKLSKIQYALAENYEVSEDAKTWTFSIRKGVKFHDDKCFKGGKGREITAEDFKYCFTQLCTANPENQLSWLFKGKVKGAEEYYLSTAEGKPLENGVEGIQVVDDHTLKIVLNYPFSGFDKILAHPGCWLFPQEALEEYGDQIRVHPVGTGPFKMKKINEGQSVFLERNGDYWDVDDYGNKLPYLQAIKVTFNKEKQKELIQFNKGNLDMVFQLPIENIKDVLADFENAKEGKNTEFDLQSIPSFTLQYYGFMNQEGIFDNEKVRKAFNYAIDKENLVDGILQGEGAIAMYGIVPPSLPGYPAKKINGYTYDREMARSLLAEAGYPKGKGFPELTLQINSGGTNYKVVAEAIQAMLKENLNIEVKIDEQLWRAHLDKVDNGEADFWRAAWIADYPDPENFLNLFYGKNVPAERSERSSINTFRYVNPQFDSIFELALEEIDIKKRYELYRECDQIVMDDAVVMPLYYEHFLRLVQKHVKNFPINQMEYRDFTEVYFDYSVEEIVEEVSN